MRISILASLAFLAMSATGCDAAGPSGDDVAVRWHCVDAAGHDAWSREHPPVWRECRASNDGFGGCIGDPMCFGADNKQMACVGQVVCVKVR